MVWSCNPVIYSQLFVTLPECLINEVWASITNHDFGNSKVRNYDFLEYFLWVLWVGRNAGKCFNLFGHVAHCHQDVLTLVWHGEGPMKSIPHTSKILTWRLLFSGIASRELVFPYFRHLGHRRTNSLASPYMFGQKNLSHPKYLILGCEYLLECVHLSLGFFENF
jgi:hypothetical protein